ncbi:MAG: alpha/beta hydrolase [bacterium]|nr:alpha/beta hydrolase [bacterium]
MSSILILHGWGSSSRSWQKVKELLESDELKVFVPDLPGFGENPAPDNPWGTDEYVEWVNTFAEKNNLSRFFLLGHSFGGGLAIKYSVKFPEKVEKLFLVAAAYSRKKTLKRTFFAAASKIFKIFYFLPFYSLARKAFYKFIIRKSDYLYVEGVMKESYLKIIKEDLSIMLSSIEMPTVIIWGKKDDLTPIKWAHFAKEKIKNSELVIIDNGDHDLNRKMPEILAEKIAKFL